MSETALIAILGAVTTLLAAVVSFVMGQRSERQRQSLSIRAELLKPIEQWLAGADKFVGIMGDTLATVIAGLPIPFGYDLEERRLAGRFMSENTNSVLGILASKSLQTGRAKGLAKKLTNAIFTLDNLIKFQLLPLDSGILDSANAKNITPELLQRASNLKMHLDGLIQSSHALISQIKTALT